MTATVLIIGMGDMGDRVAAGLAASGRVGRLVLASRSLPTQAAATLATASDCLVEPVACDAMRPEDVAALLARTRPDLVVQCAAGRSPWALADRSDPAGRAVAAAGLALRLPYQLPIPLAVMRAVRESGHGGPVANMSFPDVTGPILARLGLAPTVGLGNVGMVVLRVRAALRARAAGGAEAALRAVGARGAMGAEADPRVVPDVDAAADADAALRSGTPEAGLPLVRVIAAHSQVDGTMRAHEPADPRDRPRVFLGEDGRAGPELAYLAPAIEPGLRYNQVTAASAIPVLEALLPGAAPLRWSAPAPAGLPGGYPVRVAGGAVTLDLPPGVDRDKAIAFNERMGRGDGVERIDDDDGTVHFTEACREAVAAVAPHLAEPLPIADLAARAALLDAVLG